MLSSVLLEVQIVVQVFKTYRKMKNYKKKHVFNKSNTYKQVKKQLNIKNDCSNTLCNFFFLTFFLDNKCVTTIFVD